MANPPMIKSAVKMDVLELSSEIETGLNDTENWRLALSTVVEERTGTKSYWALTHPQPKPDFHHPDSFTLKIAGLDS
jgi:hypothetical protein